MQSNSNGAYILHLANEISPEQRRKLVLVSKLIQNLSNQLAFGNKEPYLQELNDLYMEVHIPKMRALLLFLAVRRTLPHHCLDGTRVY